MAERQWGAIRTLPSGRLQASYTGPDGIRYTAPETFSDDVRDPSGLKPRTARNKAEAWLRKQRAEIEAGTWVSPTELAERAAEDAKNAKVERFGMYAATWVEQRKSSKGQPLRPKTQNEYRRQLASGLFEFHDDRIGAITPARVRAWHDARTKYGKTQAGAEARLLRAILNTAVVDGIIESNPVPANLTRTSSGQKHRPPTPDELAVILESMPRNLRLAVLLAAYGGLRLSEWRALRRRDLIASGGRVVIDVHRQAIFIPKHGWEVGKPKSDEGERRVPLPTWMTAEISEHVSTFVGPFADSLLFAPAKGSEFMHDRQFNTPWNAAREAAGVRRKVEGKWVSVVREHDLRAFAGTSHAQSGATLAETMRFLGHKTSAAAMAYQHAADDRMTELADRMPAPPAKGRRVSGLV